MKFLIAGFGSAGRRHMHNLLSMGEKDILLYRTHRSTLSVDELEGMVVERDLSVALAHRPDAVIIANPTANHLEVAIPAAKAGCHILLEKPVSHNLDGIDELRSALKQGGGRLLVGFQFRFHPVFREIGRLLNSGAIGHPLSARAHYGDYLPGWHPWEDYRHSYSARSDLGGGAVVTLCHPLDYLRWLLGEVESVTALSGKLSDLEIQVEDMAEIGIRFTSGVIGSVHVDYYQQPPSYHFEIIGSAGTIRWDQSDHIAHIFKASENKWENIKPPEGFDRSQLFVEEMKHFLDVIYGNAQPVCTLDDGVRILQMVLAIYESNKKGKVIQF